MVVAGARCMMSVFRDFTGAFSRILCCLSYRIARSCSVDSCTVCHMLAPSIFPAILGEKTLDFPHACLPGGKIADFALQVRYVPAVEAAHVFVVGGVSSRTPGRGFTRPVPARVRIVLLFHHPVILGVLATDQVGETAFTTWTNNAIQSYLENIEKESIITRLRHNGKQYIT